MSFKRVFGVATIFLLLIILTSCSCSKQTNNSNEVIENNEEENNNEEEIEETFLYNYPLTGIGTDDQITGRSIAVVINNHPKARPQSGIDKADIVYEVMAEGRITRFLAIFQSERPEKVGPVRSARNYFINLAKGYDSLFIAHGYSPEAHAMLVRGEIDELNGMSYDGTLFKRASFRRAPHNSYITMENILKGGDQRNYDLATIPVANQFLDEEEVDQIVGESATTIKVTYSPSFDSTYEYDETKQKYLRYSNGAQTVDYDTENPVLIDNLFIVETNHQVIDSEGRLDIDLQSGGRAYLISNGKIQQVQWENQSGRIIPTSDGRAIPFSQGKTWISIIDKSPGLDSAVSIE